MTVDITFGLNMQDYIVKGLDGRLKHLRNYVGAKKRKTDEHMVKPRNIKVSRPNLPPLEDNNDGPEDTVTYERNVTLLQQQEKKTAPNQHIINDLMGKTFTIRRKRIVSNPTRVKELIETYPCLKHPDQVCTVIAIANK